VKPKPNFELHIDATSSELLSSVPIRRCVDVNDYKSIQGFVVISGGTAPSVKLEMLEVAKWNDDGIVTDTICSTNQFTDALVSFSMFSFENQGGRVCVRISEVNGLPTRIRVFIAGRERVYDV